MSKSVQEVSRLSGNFIVEYAHIRKIDNKRTPMIGYYRCWAETAEAARERFQCTQRYYQADCCNVLQVWRKAEDAS